ncbi:DsbA family protein [Chitinophagaceae bacterium LWZ2-11]
MSKLRPPVNAEDQVQGSSSATIELVEYGDYQCPHCGAAYPIIKRIQKKMGHKLKFVFRNFPLQEIHPQALGAALAAEAAGAQNKFWQMHDIIFENQQNLQREDLIQYAETIGLDVPTFKSDIKEQAFLEKVETDFESGIRSGVNGTPSFFIDGDKYNGSWDEKSLLEYLENL